MSNVQRAEPSEEELRAAWLHCRRDTWPASFEEAMADALFSRMVRLTALHPPRAHRAPPTPPRTRIFNPVRLGPNARRPAPPVFDRKRAAGGDRDDD